MADNIFFKRFSENFLDYKNGDPFPHIVIDNAFEENLLDSILLEFPALKNLVKKDNAKTTHNKGHLSNINMMGPSTVRLLHFLNGPVFLDELEKLSGIQGLVPDPYLMGAGLHCTGNGGFLKVHADFNVHPRTKLQRRINVLIYLNKDWQDDWGGALELWDSDVRNKVVEIAPVLNRMLIFNTTSDSFHGHPRPITCPEGQYRRSISVYYYTLPTESSLIPHNTLYRPVDGEVFLRDSDKEKIKAKKRELKLEKAKRKQEKSFV